MPQMSTVRSITSHTSTPDSNTDHGALRQPSSAKVALPSSQIAWEVWKDELLTAAERLVCVSSCCQGGGRLCQNTSTFLPTGLQSVLSWILMQWAISRLSRELTFMRCCLKKPKVIKSSALKQLSSCCGNKHGSLLRWTPVCCHSWNVAAEAAGCLTAEGNEWIFNSRKVLLISRASDLVIVLLLQRPDGRSCLHVGEGVCQYLCYLCLRALGCVMSVSLCMFACMCVQFTVKQTKSFSQLLRPKILFSC